MLAVALALAASACWGVADFTAGLKTRDLPVPLVLLVVQGVGLPVGRRRGDRHGRAVSRRRVGRGLGAGRDRGRRGAGGVLPRAGDRHDEHRRADLGHRRRAAGGRRHRDRRPPVGRGLRRSRRSRWSACCSPRARSPATRAARRPGRQSIVLALAAARRLRRVLRLRRRRRRRLGPVAAAPGAARRGARAGAGRPRRAGGPPRRPSGAATRRCWPWPGRSTSLRPASSAWPRRGARSASSRWSARCIRWRPCCSRAVLLRERLQPCRRPAWRPRSPASRWSSAG